MTNSQRDDNRRFDLPHVRRRPAKAQLRPSVPGRLTERRDLASRRALVRRVHAEFLDMPGLTLSVAQAARLFGLPAPVCARVFGELLDESLLCLTAAGRYTLAKRDR
jgi:hypothetical protein